MLGASQRPTRTTSPNQLRLPIRSLPADSALHSELEWAARSTHRCRTRSAIRCCWPRLCRSAIPKVLPCTTARGRIGIITTCRYRHNVHLIRAANRYVSYGDRKKFCAALKSVYTAEAAHAALMELAESPIGPEIPRSHRCLATCLGPVHPLPSVRSGRPQGHLHDQQHRIPELPAPQDHQEPRPLPLRRRRHQAALASHPRTSKTNVPAPAKRTATKQPAPEPLSATSSKAPPSWAGPPRSTPSTPPTQTASHPPTKTEKPPTKNYCPTHRKFDKLLFEGNKVETSTLVPVLKKFKERHAIADMVVVADAGMLSAANLKRHRGRRVLLHRRVPD